MTCTSCINGRYLLKKKLGEGGMGTVFLAADQLFNSREVVLKLIRTEQLDKKELDAIALFKQEYEVMTRLHHPNLAAVIDFGTDCKSGHNFLVMELVKGITLKEYLLRKKPADIKAALDIFVQVLRGLEFIHSRQLIYRDLKPENIMLTGHDQTQVKLLDFGLADNEKQIRAGVRGTIQYLAPEVFKQKIDCRSDLFAAGVLFYELAGGSSFYRQSEISSIITALSTEKQFKNNICPNTLPDADAARLVISLTAFNPDLRPVSAAAAIEKLNYFFKTDYRAETTETGYAYLSNSVYVNKNDEYLQLLNFISEETNEPLLILSGEIGIGKKRLADEIKKECRLQNRPVYRQETKPGSPFGLFTEIMAEMIAQSDAQLLNKYGCYLANLQIAPDLLKKYEPLILTDAAAEKQMNIYQFSSFIREFTDKQPNCTLLILENLEKSDDLSRELLTDLRQCTYLSENSRLKIIATFTPDSQYQNPDQLLKPGSSFEGLEILPIKPFNREQHRLYFETIFGKDKIHGSMLELVTRLHEYIGGNPLFTREVLHQLLLRGDIFKSHAQWQYNGREIETISGNLLNYYQIRLQQLTFSTKEWQALILFLLNGKALNGSSFCSLFNGYNEKSVETIFKRLEYLELVRPVKHGYEAVNELILPAATEFSGTLKIDHLRFKLIAVLEKKYGLNQYDYQLLPDENLYDLAEQYRRCTPDSDSNRQKKAAACLYYAACRYIAQYANKLAMDCFDQLLKIMPGFELSSVPINKCMILSKMVKICILNGCFDAAYQISKQEKELANQADSKNMLPDSLNNIGWCLHLASKYDQALELFKQAYSCAKEAGDEENISIALGNIGNYYIAKSDMPTALDYFKRKFNSAKKNNNLKALSSVAGNIAIVYTRMANYKTAVKYLKFKLKIDLEKNNLQGQSVVYSNLSIISLEQNQLKKALSYSKMDMDLCKKIGNRRGLSVALSNLANIYITEYQMDKARELLTAKLRIDKETGHKRGQAIVYSSLGVVYKNMEQYSQALEYLEKNLVINTEIGNELGRSVAYCNIADIYKNTSRDHDAEKYYDLAIEIAEKTNSTYYLANYQSNKAKLFLDTGRVAEADLLIARVLEMESILSNSDSILIAKILKLFSGLYKSTAVDTSERVCRDLIAIIEEKIPTKVEKLYVRFDLFKALQKCSVKPFSYNFKLAAIELFDEIKLLARKYTIESANKMLQELQEFLEKD